MTRKPCPHNVVLPKGLRCNHGYIEVLLRVKGRTYCRTFEQHTKENQELASFHLSDKRREIKLGKFGMEQEIKQKKFTEVADLCFAEWRKETDPTGKPLHNFVSINEFKRTLEKEFKPLFAKFWYDEIRPIDIEKWRERGLASGRSGTTMNRYQATLSTVFSRIETWIQTERIKPPFKLPLDNQSGMVFNPCHSVKMAPVVKRTQIPTKYEIRKLSNAFVQLNDLDGIEICKLASKSVLSTKDLKNLEIGQEIDIERAKTGVPINLPITYLVKLNWVNWRKRWEAARDLAGLHWLQFRDLRKMGINWLKGRHDIKLVSEYAGHADVKTTERSYTIKQSDQMIPLQKDLDSQVEEAFGRGV